MLLREKEDAAWQAEANLQRTQAALREANAALREANAALRQEKADHQETEADWLQEMADLRQERANHQETKDDLRRVRAILERAHAQLEWASAAMLQATAALQDQNEKLLRLTMEATQYYHRLKAANHKELSLGGKCNLRGALEHVGSTLNRGNKGSTQDGLNKLKTDPLFQAKVDDICKCHNLQKADVEKCLEDVYHTASTSMQGKELDFV